MLALTDHEIECFRRDGATVLPQLLSDEWIDALRNGVEYNRTNPSAWSHWYTNPDESIGFWTDYVTWRDVPEYRRIVFDSGLADVAAKLMGSETARFFHEHVLVKEPGASERTPWHHDQPYYSVDGDQNVSMWIALDPVPQDRAMRFLAGSHRWNRWFIPRKFIDHTPYAPESDRYELLPDIDALDRGRSRDTTGRVVRHRAGRRDRVPLPHAARCARQCLGDRSTSRGQPALGRRRCRAGPSVRGRCRHRSSRTDCASVNGSTTHASP